MAGPDKNYPRPNHQVSVPTGYKPTYGNGTPSAYKGNRGPAAVKAQACFGGGSGGTGAPMPKNGPKGS